MMTMKYVWGSIFLAAFLWFLMFSPFTSTFVPFWPTMAFSGVLLSALSFYLGGSPFRGKHSLLPTIVWGVMMAVGLWCLFWVGDKASQFLFCFARSQVDAIYDMKSGFPQWAIALLLLLVIGPAEELFWRGFVQRRMAARWGACKGFLLATFCYTLVHVWSGNLMLLLAAATCGFCWGGLYCLMPKRLPALILSHALWDAAAFVFFPF